MNFPSRLIKGDTVAILAPSSPVTKEEADLCRDLVESMGYKVKTGKTVYRSIHGYSAGTGQEKADDLHQMFADPEIKAIWCIRGGDTSSHIVDKLDYELVRNNPKIFLGYSDVTNLHVNFNQKCDLVTFHGPMVKSNMLHDFDDFTKRSFEAALAMEEELFLENPEGVNFQVMVEGYAEGTIVGGNLTLLTSMIGTPYEVDTKGKILFIEDIGESVRRLDRMIHQLKYSNKLQDARGIIVGDFADCDNATDRHYTVIELLKDLLNDYKKPVMYNIKSGHCYPMSTIPLGVTCTIDTSSRSIKFTR
jgi:muramoyltetrapeptide carboxypeptidase